MTCLTCDGTGKDPFNGPFRSDPCPHCKGEGVRLPDAEAALLHCGDCDPSFLDCWNDRSKCRKMPRANVAAETARAETFLAEAERAADVVERLAPTSDKATFLAIVAEMLLNRSKPMNQPDLFPALAAPLKPGTGQTRAQDASELRGGGTVFVDALTDCVMTPRWRFDQACHLFCDPGELDTLHTFARRLGLRREWFQNRPGLPHYDLNASRRAEAVASGAVEVDRYAVVATMKKWRAAT